MTLIDYIAMAVLFATQIYILNQLKKLESQIEVIARLEQYKEG